MVDRLKESFQLRATGSHSAVEFRLDLLISKIERERIVYSPTNTRSIRYMQESVGAISSILPILKLFSHTRSSSSYVSLSLCPAKRVSNFRFRILHNNNKYIDKYVRQHGHSVMKKGHYLLSAAAAVLGGGRPRPSVPCASGP